MTMTYPDQESQSAALYRRASQVLAGGSTRLTTFFSPYPIYAGSGSGSKVTDADGVERVDCLNNYMTLIHGHAHPEVVQAIVEQVRRGSCFAMPTEREVELAEVITGRVDSVETMRFCNSGSEAVLVAVKAARAYTGRPMVAKCEGAYHGCYDPVEVSLSSSPRSWGDPASRPGCPTPSACPRRSWKTSWYCPTTRPRRAGPSSSATPTVSRPSSSIRYPRGSAACRCEGNSPRWCVRSPRGTASC